MQFFIKKNVQLQEQVVSPTGKKWHTTRICTLRSSFLFGPPYPFADALLLVPRGKLVAVFCLYYLGDLQPFIYQWLVCSLET